LIDVTASKRAAKRNDAVVAEIGAEMLHNNDMKIPIDLVPAGAGAGAGPGAGDGAPPPPPIITSLQEKNISPESPGIRFHKTNIISCAFPVVSGKGHSCSEVFAGFFPFSSILQNRFISLHFNSDCPVQPAVV
jgi:hypothetical protein